MELYLELAGRELAEIDTGEVETDLQHITNTVIRLQTQTVAGQAFVGLIAEAQLNPATRADFAEFAQQRRQVTRRVLRRAIDRGQIRPETDIDVFIDALGGATTFRLLQGHAPLSAKFTKAIVALLLSGCRTYGRASGKEITA